MDSESMEESGPIEQTSSTATDVQPGPTIPISNEHSTTESTQRELTPEEVREQSIAEALHLVVC